MRLYIAEKALYNNWIGNAGLDEPSGKVQNTLFAIGKHRKMSAEQRSGSITYC